MNSLHDGYDEQRCRDDERLTILLNLKEQCEANVRRAARNGDGGGMLSAQAELDTVLWDLEALDNE